MKKIHVMLMGMLALVVLTAASCSGSANVTADKNEEADNTATSDSSVEVDANADISAKVPKTVTVEYTASGFSPATVTINKGDTVRFVNKSASAFWPASAPHPTHTDYPGFDAKKNIAVGGTYEFTFDKVGTWTYHNHLNSTHFGKIIVK